MASTVEAGQAIVGPLHAGVAHLVAVQSPRPPVSVGPVRCRGFGVLVESRFSSVCVGRLKKLGSAVSKDSNSSDSHRVESVPCKD